MTAAAISHSQNNLQIQSALPDENTQRKPTNVGNIVEIVAFAALALVAAAVAALAAFVLSGVVAAIIAGSVTAVVSTIAAVVYKVLQTKKATNSDPVQVVNPQPNDIIREPTVIGSLPVNAIKTKPAPVVLPVVSPNKPRVWDAASIDISRKAFLSSLGKIDPQLITVQGFDAPAFNIVHRANGNIAIVTRGLWNPNDSSLPGSELLVEFPETPEPTKHPVFLGLLQVATTINNKRQQFSDIMKKHGFYPYKANHVTDLPYDYADPSRPGKCCLFVGFDSSKLKTYPIPKTFKGPNNEDVSVYTVRLLTRAEWKFVENKKSGGRHRLAEKLTTHISNITIQPFPPLPTLIPLRMNKI